MQIATRQEQQEQTTSHQPGPGVEGGSVQKKGEGKESVMHAIVLVGKAKNNKEVLRNTRAKSFFPLRTFVKARKLGRKEKTAAAAKEKEAFCPIRVADLEHRCLNYRTFGFGLQCGHTHASEGYSYIHPYRGLHTPSSLRCR